jgi:5'-nucleotidase (lipoprotein e(P4) family)
MKLLIRNLILLLIISSCSSVKTTSERDYQVGAYLWFQTSGEYKALCYQAYNLAKMKLDLDLQNKHNKKRAMIFDIDETVLDNSVGGAYELKNNIPWSKENLELWVSKKAASAVPGSREFIDYAVSKKVEIFYVSNRSVKMIDDTFLNLKKLNFYVKKENMLFLDKIKSKESRRLEILNKFEVVLLFGDNLVDFDQVWDNKGSIERASIVDSNASNFGEKFIVLPNPLYGDWENSLPKALNRKDLLNTNF